MLFERITRHGALWLFLLSLCSPPSASAAVYHVAPFGDDGNAGTAAAPWRSLAKANMALQAGDTVLIHAGTYGDPIRPAADGTSNEERITYRAFGDGDVVLTGFPGLGGPEEGALALGLKRYVTVSGRAAGDGPETRRIRLTPLEDVNSLGNVCGSEGVVVENIHAECPDNDRNCSRGFGFCINFWAGNHETRYNVLRRSTILGNSDPGPDPNDFTEDVVTVAHRSHHNLIEDNVLGTCRHTSLYADSPDSHSNVIRGNRIVNPQHTALSIWSAGVALPNGARFLVEGNHLSASGAMTDPDGGAGNAFQWGSDELIIRHNVITRGGSADFQTTSIGGLMGATSTSFGSQYFATDGRVYNNTVADNRGLAVGMFDFGVDPVDLGRHVFVNNVFYGSDSDSTGDLLAVYWDADFATADRYIANVWGNPLGDPMFSVIFNAHHGGANLADAVAVWRNPQDPEVTLWHGFANVYDAAPGFVDYAAGDFRLGASSSHIDSGAPLTRVATGDPGSGTTVHVEDARFFFGEAAEFPAWMGVQPEWIAVGASFSGARRAQIVSVDDALGRLVLDRAVSRSPGDFVWLWKDSSGRQVAAGGGPEIGACENQVPVFADGFESGDAGAWTSEVPKKPRFLVELD